MIRDEEHEAIWARERILGHARHAIRLAEAGEGPECPTERLLVELERERDEAVAARDHMLKKSEELLARHEL